MRANRSQLDPRALVRPRLAAAMTVLVMAVAVTACGGLGETAAGDVRDGPATGEAVRLTMGDDLFDPASIQVAAGTSVVVEIHNEGERNHNFTIESLNVSTGPMEPGDVKTATFTPEAGTTRFVCTWHDGMVGTIEAA